MSWLEANFHNAIATELQHLGLSDGCSDELSVRAALVRAFKAADEKLESLGEANCGSTATVALLHETQGERTLYVANVGDSRAILIGGSSVAQLTIDHIATNPNEIARVESEGGAIFRRRVWGALSVTRSMGDHDFKTGGVSCAPDIFAGKVAGANALVIASDGLWDVMDGEDVKKVLEDSISNAMEVTPEPKCLATSLQRTAAQDLVDCAKEKGSCDNICVVVVFL